MEGPEPGGRVEDTRTDVTAGCRLRGVSETLGWSGRPGFCLSVVFEKYLVCPPMV